MNTRVYIWASVCILALIVMAKTSFFSTLLAFLVLGIIPGTNFTLPTWAILAAYPLAFFGIVYWLTMQSLYVGETRKPAKSVVKTIKKKTSAKHRDSTVAKRRSRAVV